MTETVLPDRLPAFTLRAGKSRHLATLPHTYAIASRGEYAHLPRAANTHPNGGICVIALCGQLMHRPTLTDEPPGPICATCHGRQTGLHQPDTYAYRPVLWQTLPRHWCKSLNWAWIDDTHTTARCANCGHEGGTWWVGGPWGGHLTIRRHEHGGVGTLCPDHGQRWLAPGPAGTLTCNYHTCEHPPLVRFGPNTT